MQITSNVLRKFGAKVAAPLALVPLALVGNSAHAAVDADVLAAVTTAGADLLIVAAAVTGIMAALWAAMLIKRKFFG